MPRTRIRHAALAAIVGLTACTSSMSIEDARLADVVSVDGVTLDGATLEEMMLSAPTQASPSPPSAAMMISAFVDAAVFRKALVDGRSFEDSLLVRTAIIPDATLGIMRESVGEMARAMPPVSDEQADSLGRLGSVRVFQHILFAVVDYQDSLEGNRIRARLSDAMQQLTEGADFAEMARQISDDTLSSAAGGILPALTRDELPPGPIVAAAWRLTPGEFSAPAASPTGVHIIRRVPAADAREGLREWLAPRLAQQADSLWLDSLRSTSGVTLAEDAVDRTRILVSEPFTIDADAADLVSWDGGGLSPAEVRMWFSILPAPERAGMPFISDSAISGFLELLAGRALRFAASGETDPVPPRAWEALAPQFMSIMNGLAESYRDLLMIGDSSTAVRQFLIGAAEGTVDYRPFPGAVAMQLRDGVDIQLDQAAIDAIVATASRDYGLRREQDSIAAMADSASAATATP